MYLFTYCTLSAYTSFLPLRRPSRTFRATIVSRDGCCHVVMVKKEISERFGGSRHDWTRCDSRVVVFLVDHGDLRPCRELHIVVRALQPYDKTECLVCMIPFPGCAEAIRDGGEYVLCKDGRRGDMMDRGDMSYLLHAAARDLTSCRPCWPILLSYRQYGSGASGYLWRMIRGVKTVVRRWLRA